LRAFMLGRARFDFADASGRPATLQWDAGFLSARSEDGTWLYLETLGDRTLAVLADAAAMTKAAEISAAGADAAAVIVSARPGFEGGHCIAVAEPDETVDQLLARAGQDISIPKPDAETKDAHLDPARNPFLPGSTAPEPPPIKIKAETAEAPHLDPAKNPFIKIA
jgi:hypothetical protein